MRIINKYQEGGPAPQGGGDPMQQLLQAAAEAAQSQNCELALQVCQVLVQMAQGGGAPQGGEKEPPAEEPTYARRGARLVRIRR